MDYKGKIGAGMLFFTVFIVGFSFAGGVIPPAAYAEEDGYALFQADDSFNNGFFGTPDTDCCGNAVFMPDPVYTEGTALFQPDPAYAESTALFQSDPLYAESTALFQPDGLYQDTFALFQPDPLYQQGGPEVVDLYDVYDTYGNNYGGRYGGGQYGGQQTTMGGSYAHSFGSNYSTVSKINSSTNYYTVQSSNPYIYPRPTCQINQALAGGYNQGAYLSWTSTNATSASITNLGSVPVNGNRTVYPSGTMTYVMTVWGQGGSNTCSVTVHGYTPPTPIPSPVLPSCEIHYAQADGYNYGYNYNNNYYNNGALLSWSSSNASSATISNIGSVATNGSQYVYPSGSTTYVMTVYGVNGGSNTCSTTVPGYQYNPPVYPPIYPGNNLYCTISATQNGAYGYGAVLNWTSYGAQSATLSDGIGNVALSGSLTVRPETARTYTLTISDYQGHVNTCSTQVGAIAMPYVSLTSIPYTGFDGGLTAQIIYWLALVLFSGAAAYLIVNYRGGIGSVFADVFGRRYAPAAVTPDAVILHETIIAREQPKQSAAEPIVREARAASAAKMDRMTLEGDGEMPRLVIQRA